MHTVLRREVSFVTTQELEDLYPDLTPSAAGERLRPRAPHDLRHADRSASCARGKPHDGRAPDYDDWTLNGDILFWNPRLERAFEVSSMGIRVDPAAMDRQLTLAGCDDRRTLPFHRALLAGELPQTIGGGIGQSRLCMLMLGVCHIGEVQAGIWDPETHRICEAAGITLL